MATPNKPSTSEPAAPFSIKEGYYWATHSRYGWRAVLRLQMDGFRHLRFFCARCSGSFGVEEFIEVSGPLVDPKEKP